MPQFGSHAGGLHHAAVLGNVAKQDGHASVLGVGMLYVAYATVLAVGIETLVVGFLCAQLVAELAGRGREENLWSGQVGVLVSRFSPGNGQFGVSLVHAVCLNILFQRMTVHTLQTGINQSALVQFGHQSHHAAGSTKLLHAVLLTVGGQLHQEGRFAREGVYVVHREVHPSLLCHGQQVQHRVGRGTHGYIHCHGVQESLAGGNAAWQHALVAILVVGHCVLHNQSGRLSHQSLTVLMRGQNGAVAGQRQADGLRQVVHRVGREHSRTAAAAGTGTVLNLLQVGIAHGGVAALNHGYHQVQVLALVLTGLHRTAAHEYRRNVQSHGGHQHARCNLVAVRDAYHGVRLVAVHHIFHRVGNDVARWQRVEHAVVSHGNAVVYGDGVELSGIAAHFFYLFLYYLSCLVQMSMSGHKLSERVNDGDDRLAKLLAFHAVGHPEGACAGHSSAFGAYRTT